MLSRRKDTNWSFVGKMRIGEMRLGKMNRNIINFMRLTKIHESWQNRLYGHKLLFCFLAVFLIFFTLVHVLFSLCGCACNEWWTLNLTSSTWSWICILYRELACWIEAYVQKALIFNLELGTMCFNHNFVVSTCQIGLYVICKPMLQQSYYNLVALEKKKN